ncbi:LuxR C-terminal-related transcriptional regulator [Streptomyces sp. MI02-2A]|uniref:LuxR C-terminal-related transcriptional regulator n=1 Tax=unclassified Streptomyces TaxID=2593676 RepID=UPI0015F2940C|nr:MULTISPECIES: LuxR C-terminal-related transcriptional regulator [unclassified Streptomyces]MDX3265819.1 LuxR C-terminal-related transcriptional regulator [Streptomyces sp. MI02-2A]
MRTAGRSQSADAQMVPAVQGGIVSRPALFAQLGKAARVTTIAAPAGSGKTVVLRSWIREAGLAERAAFVSVQREESDPQRFWIAVCDALRATAAGSDLVRPLTKAPDLDGWTIVERLLQDLAPLGDHVWLIIDDLHELRSAEAQRQLELLVMRAPAEVRFVLSTRRDLRLGLHRLRLEAGLTEIRADGLRFSLEEARALFHGAGVELSRSTLARLHERTEGWVAGLRLAALSLAGHPDPEGFAAGFAGSERTVADYLLAEVMERQSEEVRRLLLRTSVLERVNGELADLLTGGSGAERVLQDLEQAGAFVVSLDARRSWFRYHTMFADLLQLELRRTAPEEITAVHRAAAGWYAEHGHPVEAIRHAQAAGHWGPAARLLSDHWIGLGLDGQAATAHALLAGFPVGVIAADGELTALAAFDEAEHGSLGEAERQLALATHRSESVPRDRREHFDLMVTVLRLLLARQRGDLPAVVEEAQRLLASGHARDAAEPERGDELRALALISLGIAETWSVWYEDADRHLERGVALAHRIGRPYLEILGLAHWAVALLSWAPAPAAERGGQAIELARQHGWTEEPIVAAAYLALGAHLIWRGRLDEAESWLERAERAVRQEADPVTGLMLHYGRGLLELARGHDEDALAGFRSAGRMRDLVVAHHPLATKARAFQLHTLVRLGEAQRVERALAEMEPPERETGETRAALAALHLAREDPQAATAALAPVLDGSASPMEPRGWLVQPLLLEAIARDALGDPAAAGRALERALDLAEPGATVLPFLLHPAPEVLERQARRATAHAAMISEILDLLAGKQGEPAAGEPARLREPLTHSEIRVLRYLPTNLSAPEIADELSLSVNTVRTHMRHVYGKLGTHSRSQAVERARALGLLAPSSRRP